MPVSVASTRNEIIMAHIFCVAQQFCAVTVYVLGKKVMEVVDAHIFVYMRLLFVIPIVLTFAWILTRKFASFKAPFKPALFMVLSGIIGIVISQSLMFAGLDKSTATNTSIIRFVLFLFFWGTTTNLNVFVIYHPILTFTLVLHALHCLRLSFLCFVGLIGLGFVSSIAGAMLLLQVWNFKFEGTTLGNLLIVGSALCSAVNALVQKHVLNEGYHPLVVQSYVVCSGVMLYTIGYSPFGLFEPHAWVLAPRVWMYIAIVGIVATGLPWCLGIIALKHTSPMTTSFVGVVIMGEVLTWIQMLGSALVLLGLVFVNATPVVHKVISLVKRRIASQAASSKEFVLLDSEEDKNVELESLSEKKVEVSESAVYEFNQSTETNAFVIDDEQESAILQTEAHVDVIPTPSAVITIGNGNDDVITYKDSIPTATLQPILVA